MPCECFAVAANCYLWFWVSYQAKRPKRCIATLWLSLYIRRIDAYEAYEAYDISRPRCYGKQFKPNARKSSSIATALSMLSLCIIAKLVQSV
jgi:hypothetical protein